MLNKVYCLSVETLLDELRERMLCPNLIYADVIYDDKIQPWLPLAFDLVQRGGYVVVQTDYRSVAEIKIQMDDLGQLINWVIWPYDWGGRPKDAFGRKHDDILIYSTIGGQRTFNAEAVAIPKTVMMRSTKDWKIPTDVWSDIGNFYTTSKERIKEGGKNVPWQKPLALMERIILALTNEQDLVVDPMCGTGTTLVAAKKHNRSFIGGDIKKSRVKMSERRLKDDSITSC